MARQSKFTDEQIQEMVKLRNQGKKIQEIIDETGIKINHSHCSRICRQRSNVESKPRPPERIKKHETGNVIDLYQID